MGTLSQLGLGDPHFNQKSTQSSFIAGGGGGELRPTKPQNILKGEYIKCVLCSVKTVCYVLLVLTLGRTHTHNLCALYCVECDYV